MAKDFIDLADAAHQLAEVLHDSPDFVVSIQPNGAVIAQVLASKFGCHIVEAVLDSENISSTDAVSINLEGVEPTSRLLVVDDAVETGQAAWAVASKLRSLGFTDLHLAVPICPRQSAYQLGEVYSTISAVVRPLAKRSLTWHYEQTPATSMDLAHSIVESHNKDQDLLQ